MSSQEFFTRIQLKRDTEDNWLVNNPVLLKGEMAIVDSPDFDGQRFKIGDGNSTYSELPFADDNLYTNVEDLWDRLQGMDEKYLEKLASDEMQNIGWTQDGLAISWDDPQFEYGMRLYGDDEASNLSAVNSIGITNYRFIARGTAEYNVATEEEVAEQLKGKVDKVAGKGLSTNDFTNGWKEKLDGIDYSATSRECKLNWGANHIAGRTSPVDAAFIAESSANRLAFFPPRNIDIEYSRDGGATWLDYEATDRQKTELVSGLQTYIYLGKWVQGETATPDWKLRITLNNTIYPDWDLYSMIRKTAIFLSTAGATGCTVTVEGVTIGSPDTFVTLYDRVPVDGWSGWNIIQMGNKAFGGYQTSSANYKTFRFTFGITGITSGYSSALCVQKMQMFGETLHAQTTSPMAENGHIYTYDYQKVVYFPNTVSAPYFYGTAEKAVLDTQGNYIISTYLKKSDAENIYATKEEIGAKLDANSNIYITQDTADWSYSGGISPYSIEVGKMGSSGYLYNNAMLTSEKLIISDRNDGDSISDTLTIDKTGITKTYQSLGEDIDISVCLSFPDKSGTIATTNDIGAKLDSKSHISSSVGAKWNDFGLEVHDDGFGMTFWPNTDEVFMLVGYVDDGDYTEYLFPYDRDGGTFIMVPMPMAADEGKISLVVLHIGGEERRGENTDPILNVACPGADLMIVVNGGNFDGYFSKSSETNNVPLYLYSGLANLVAPLTHIYTAK